uniref:oligoribonuclease, mitochondrial-like isoform X2 n=1 Tax=Styela clava TaxID=7725 RepID=UPI00193A0CB2|nr:oligoribonuclease, mitochondrial-like isoform X2 [Styela clava]
MFSKSFFSFLFATIKILSMFSLINQLKVINFRTWYQIKRNSLNMADRKSGRMIWVDLEMTGLDVDKDKIIEIACIVTDAHLKIIAEGPNLIIHESEELLSGMDEWCQQHHGASGLTEAVRKSKISTKDAEDEVLQFVKKYTSPKVCPLAGNSVHADKKFLDKYMPMFSNHLHYRIIDVSTVKELCKRWYPGIYNKAPTKQGSHRAMGDIMESIKELKYYKDNMFIQT